MLYAPRDLPFRVTFPDSPFFELRDDVHISIVRVSGTEGGIRAIDRALSVFEGLAQAGGLGGDTVSPWDSGVQVERRSVTGTALEYIFRRCCLADQSLIALCDLLSHPDVCHNITELVLHGRGVSHQLTTDFRKFMEAYPARNANLPFTLSDHEPEYGTYTIVATLDGPVQPGVPEALQSLLDAWTAFVLSGGFTLPPQPPQSNYVEPEPLVAFEDTLEWTFFKLNSHDAAIDSLVNLLAAFSQRHQRILEVALT